jgi:arginase family enzyme
MTPAGLVLIGVPANSSGTVDGVARAPAALRQRGLATGLARHPGFTDAGDLALPVPVPVRGPSGLLAEDALVAMIGQVAQAVGTARRRGRFPLLLGGDCPVILGALAALQAEADRPGLLFVDGHEDAWPPRMSPTGEAADCELGLALRLFDTGLSPQLRAVLPRVDPADVAAVDYAQPGGVSWDQLAGLTATALAADGCAGWSVCIYNPDLDPGHDGADAIVSYITQAITAGNHPGRWSCW